MANLMESARNEVGKILSASYQKAVGAGKLPQIADFSGATETPKDVRNGDLAANHALVSSKQLKMAPRDAAQILAEFAELDGTYFSSVEIAGPGFLNFRYSSKWYGDALAAIESMGDDYGRSPTRRNEKVMVEFVSANPTGPMTIGNARGGVLGDSLAAILDMDGCDVWREFYVNDEGNQIELFALSIEARYLQIINGEKNVPFPENGYHGDDIRELAALIYERHGEEYLDVPGPDRRAAMAAFALPHNIDIMKKTLERYGIHYDLFFSESSLYKNGSVAKTLEFLTSLGYTYEKDGAIWLKNTQFGADKDEVMLRSNGFYTYYCVDIAYHLDKFITRGFDRVIDVLGADHHGHSLRFAATMSAPDLGLDGKKLEFLIMQMVRLVRGGETVKVSKRTGKAITLNDLLDEIGIDACRFFFNAKPDTHLEFDMDLAVRQDSDNPVYYVQYAHARICSLVSNLAASGHSVKKTDEIDAGIFRTEHETELIKQLALLPDEVRLAARDLDPSRIGRYVTELSARFHKFYSSNRIKDAEQKVLDARLLLADHTRRVIAQSLKIIGVAAPEKM